MAPDLAQLERVRLATSWRHERRTVYAINVRGLRELLSFLTDDCCQGHEELCRDLRQSARYGHPRLVTEGSSIMSEKIYNVLFLCTGNSARSVMAECALNRHGAGRFKAFSAGSHPKGEVHSITLELLRKFHHDTSGLRSKSWDEFAGAEAPPLDFVFTVCAQAAGEVCPVWPGQPMSAHWGVEDPAAVEGSEEHRRRKFRDIYFQLERRIQIFANLPIRSLDKLTLQKRLAEIGTTSATAGTAS